MGSGPLFLASISRLPDQTPRAGPLLSPGGVRERTGRTVTADGAGAAADLGFAPKLSSRKLEDGTLVSATLEDMFPFLDREEFARHMIDPEPRKG